MADEPTPEQIAAALRASPMRMMNRLVCGECGHQWQQPSATGACPRCHSEKTEVYDALPCMAPIA
jgi:rubrerythrin